MISKVVRNIFWVLYTLFIEMCFVAAIITDAVWLATSGELLIIVPIVTFAIGFVVLLAFAVISLKELIETCRETDKILKEMQNDEDKS